MMVEPANREESDAPRTARVRTAGETSRRGSGSSGSSRSRDRRPSSPPNKRTTKHPAPVSGMPGAKRSRRSGRVVAPIGLIIFAIACFTVITNGSDSSANKAATTKSVTTKKTTKVDTGAGGSAVVTTKKTYTVKAGDSLGAIASKTGVSVDTLTQLNSGIDPRNIQPGQKIKLK